MTNPRMTVLVVSATGSIGRLVVEEALRQGHAVRALVRTPGKARRLPPTAQVVPGDVTRPDTLSGAVDGVHAVVFTLGSDGAGKVGAEGVDYGGVRNVLGALGSRTARIALMTAIGVTNRTGAYNRATERRFQSWGSGGPGPTNVPPRPRRLHPCHWAPRLEAALREAGARQRTAVHDRATRLVRLQPSGRAPAGPPAGRYAPGRRFAAMASLRGARSPKSWSAASARIAHCGGGGGGGGLLHPRLPLRL